MQSYGVNCERDEFPPAIIWQGRDDDQWMRFLPESQNGGAGQLFNGICDDTPRSHTTNEHTVDGAMQDCRPWKSWTRTIWTTFSVLDLQFDLMPGLTNYGLVENPCYPLTLVNGPGFALLYEDPYYFARPNDCSYAEDYYPDPPPAAVTQGKDFQAIIGNAAPGSTLTTLSSWTVTQFAKPPIKSFLRTLPSSSAQEMIAPQRRKLSELSQR